MVPAYPWHAAHPAGIAVGRSIGRLLVNAPCARAFSEFIPTHTSPVAPGINRMIHHHGSVAIEKPVLKSVHQRSQAFPALSTFFLRDSFLEGIERIDRSDRRFPKVELFGLVSRHEIHKYQKPGAVGFYIPEIIWRTRSR